MAPEEARPGKINTSDVIRVIISWVLTKCLRLSKLYKPLEHTPYIEAQCYNSIKDPRLGLN